VGPTSKGKEGKGGERARRRGDLYFYRGRKGEKGGERKTDRKGK